MILHKLRLFVLGHMGRNMSAKEIILSNVINSGTSETFEFPKAIPANEIWTIKEFGAADINMGDNISSIYVLRFGTDIIKIIALTGNTHEFILNKSLKGDGLKKLNVYVSNKSGFSKQMPFWIKGFVN